MFCQDLVNYNHNFFLKSLRLSLIACICAEDATDNAAVSLENWCFSFALRHAFQGFTVCNVLLVHVGSLF